MAHGTTAAPSMRLLRLFILGSVVLRPVISSDENSADPPAGIVLQPLQKAPMKASRQLTHLSLSFCCLNEIWRCLYLSDGECDDGGPGSEWFVCPLGSDCLDCGDRCTPSPPPGPPALPATPTPPPVCCTNSCSNYFVRNTVCDDGGPGATFSVRPAECRTRIVHSSLSGGSIASGPCKLSALIFQVCDFGTDCDDCGNRCSNEPLAPPSPPVCCNDWCILPRNGICDDGGPGSQYSICAVGTDCADCGK